MKATGVNLNRIGGPLEVADLELETPSRRGTGANRSGGDLPDRSALDGGNLSLAGTDGTHSFPLDQIDDAIATLECGDAGRVVLIPEHN